MTSSATQQPANAAPNNAAAPAATSYASAAGAAKKSSSTPIVATGSNPPIVAAGSSKPASNHAKSSSVSPMNGRPNITPAVPAASPSPAVVHGTSTANGQSDHNRNSSFAMSRNGANNYSTNGASTGTKPDIKFGYQDSPAITHSTPQPPSAPVPIPGADNRGVTEPRLPPSPIPQPSASGGKPPTGAPAPGSTLAFGSFDGDRPHMRASSTSQDPSALGPHTPHIRRGSNVSDVSNHNGPHPGGMGRGNFSGGPRGGRAYSGGFNPSMAYTPNNYNRSQQGNSGRGGMPPNFGGNGRPHQQHFGTPPQQSRSPAMTAAMPQALPSMPPGQMPAYYYNQPPMGPSQTFYQAQYDPRNTMPPMQSIHAYPGYPNIQNQGSPMPHYQQPFVPNPYPQPIPQPMSRSNSSQISDPRPASSTGQNQTPVIQGTPQQQAAKTSASPAQFSRPAKRVSAAIVIKNEAGEPLDVKAALKRPPASPALTNQASRTPPVGPSTPTPPPKASTPKPLVSAHSRADSVSNLKTDAEIRNEFKEKIKQSATGDKPKEEDVAKPPADKAPVVEAQIVPEPAAQSEAKADDPAKEDNTEKESVEDAGKEAAVAEKSDPAPPAETEDEALERMIREMEEADALREKAEEERRVKKAAEDAAKKETEEKTRVANAAENDRKLREQEREMEKLEEERERKRAAAQGGATESAAELLKKPSAPAVNDKEESSPVAETAAKLSGLGLSDKPSTSGSAKPGLSSRAPKPQALNLAQLSTKAVEAPQPSAALQSLKTARLLDVVRADIYPPGISSPNPALNSAVAKKGTSFKYDSAFLLQFKTVFTEQPSLDFHQQVKSLIGDGDGGRSASNRSGGGSGRQNTRNNASSFPVMGSFGTGGVQQQLPAGTTSAQRFEMSNKAMGSRPAISTISSFHRPGGAFTGGSQMSRTPSSNLSGMPNSPRQGSRRNASKPSAVNAKAEALASKNMPLTANMKIEALPTSTTGWKPLSVGRSTASNNAASSSPLMEPAMVQRKVKASLNKMTPENFDRISDQILEIAGQSKEETDGRTLRQVIQLTFEKATDEAHWASMYAKFCKKMLETMSADIRDENIKDRSGNVVSGGALFRKYLLNRCQEEFERGWAIQLPDEPKEGSDQKAAAAVLLSDEYYKAAAAKRRGLGLVQFIGELYKLGMLTERIMHECVRKLVDYQGIPDEAEVESLCKLLKTIGGNLDADKGKPMMDAYFQRIQTMVDLPGLPSRLQFMLMDIVDLRKANWHSKEANKGPKTLDEVRAEAEALAAQKAAEAARSNQRGGGGRAPLGRGDVRHLQGGFPQPAQNQVGMDDLRRLKGGTNRLSSATLTLGPSSMLNSRSNSGRRLGPGGSLSRGAEDSGASSRTGTPPVRETPTSTNSFGLLATMDSEHPGSPPSTAASPALAKATPETSATSEKGGN